MQNYSYKNSPEYKSVDLKLYYCGTEACSPGHSWGPGVKDHYKIHYVHSGKGVFQTNGHTYSLGEGQLFLICPNTVAYYAADSDEPWSYSWVAFNGLNAEAYLSRAALSVDNPIMKCSSGGTITRCFEEMFDGSRSETSGDIKLLAGLYSFLGILVEEADEPAGTQRRRGARNADKTSDLYIKKAVEFIKTNYSRKITVKEIAGHVGVSTKYLSKLFAEASLMPPQNFLVGYRMDKALELLKTTELSIIEVSNSVGYSDPFLFSRVFKKYKGQSPKLFRQNYIDSHNRQD